MANKPKNSKRSAGVHTDDVATDLRNSPLSDADITKEFDRLVEHMQSPQHQAAIQRLAEMSPKDLQEFFLQLT